MPAATPRAKNTRNIQGAVPNDLSRNQPKPAPSAIARTNEMPTVLSAPIVRMVSAMEPLPRLWGCGSSMFYRSLSGATSARYLLSGDGDLGAAVVEPSVHGASTINPAGAPGTATGAAGLLQSDSALAMAGPYSGLTRTTTRPTDDWRRRRNGSG